MKKCEWVNALFQNRGRRSRLRSRRGIFEAVTSLHIPEAVTSLHIPEAVTTLCIPEAVTTLCIPEAVTSLHNFLNHQFGIPHNSVSLIMRECYDSTVDRWNCHIYE